MHARTQNQLSVRQRGFTLLELLVTIAVIAVLLTIILPALSVARVVSARTKSLTNIRSIVQTFVAYSESYGTYPFGTAGWVGHTSPSSDTVNTDDGYWFGTTYPEMRSAWPMLMHGVAPWQESVEAWLSPGRTELSQFGENPLIPGIGQSPMAWSDYHYSHCFMGPPRAWDSSRTSAEGLAPQPTRPGQVRFPSKKVIIHDFSRLYLNKAAGPDTPRPVGFTDGSGKTVLDRDAAEPVKSVLSQFVVENGPLGTSPQLYHDTPMGVGGVDF